VQMSSSQNPPTSTSSNPTSTDTLYDGPHDSPSSNLYLFTFLSTLVLLLAISCAIVFRSFMLRRRFHHRMQGVMAAGILLPPQNRESRRRRFGTKPKFYDAWLMPGGHTWNEMMPVSVQSLRRSRHTPKESSSRSARSDQRHNGPSPRRHLRFFESWSFPPWRNTSPASPSPLSSSSACLEKPPLSEVRAERLQLSILVAMPSPQRLHNSSTTSLPGREGELPDLVLGVTRLPYCKA